MNVLSNSLEAGVNEYLLEIHVYPSITETVDPIVVPTVHVKEWDGPKVSDPGWRISYKAPDEKMDDKQDEKQDDNQTGNHDNKQDGTCVVNIRKSSGLVALLADDDVHPYVELSRLNARGD